MHIICSDTKKSPYLEAKNNVEYPLSVEISIFEKGNKNSDMDLFAKRKPQKYNYHTRKKQTQGDVVDFEFTIG